MCVCVCAQLSFFFFFFAKPTQSNANIWRCFSFAGKMNFSLMFSEKPPTFVNPFPNQTRCVAESTRLTSVKKLLLVRMCRRKLLKSGGIAVVMSCLNSNQLRIKFCFQPIGTSSEELFLSIKSSNWESKTNDRTTSFGQAFTVET